MRLYFANRLASSIAVLALAVAVIPAGAALAAASPGWNVGSCFTTAEVQNDLVDLNSAVSCAKPHTVQVIGGAALSPVFAEYSLTQLRDQKDTGLRAALAEFGQKICSGTVTAAGIWPKQGAALAKVLTGFAATAAGGVLPGLKEHQNFGWVFPDTAAFNAGDRSMICVIYSPDQKKGAGVAAAKGLQGNAQLLGTTSTLPTMRSCSKLDGSGKNNIDISCSKPHVDELIAHFVGKLPADVSAMTDAQWVPYDAQCQAIMDVLVGAKRTDLRVRADPDGKAKANTLIYVPCFASRSKSADGKHPNLPGGTLVGLGNKPLKAA
ncbi:MAG: septum formation family protein [Actinomycetota bacterium]|nr:septum formation family protein [Actinomycetota bacterium]